MKKYMLSFSIGVLLGVVVILFLKHAVESFAVGPDSDARKFDKKLWAKSKNGQDRFEMVDDLQIYYLRKGITKREVIKLLGKPDAGGHYHEAYSDTSSVISYEMGFVFLDPCTFDLEFSKDKRLISYETNCN